MATFVLISGAWHGGWCWEYLIPRLEARGHRALGPDLPGMGDDRTPPAVIDRDHWARFVADIVMAQDEKICLLGHSRAGMTITDAGALAADNIACLVYLAAMLPPIGPQDVDIARFMTDHDLEKMRLDFDQQNRTHMVAAEQVTPLFYHRAPPALAERARARLRPEPIATTYGDAHAQPHAKEHVDALPRIYVECLDDRAVPIAVQRRIQQRVPFDATYAIDSDHSPFYSDPEGLADLLDRIVQDLPRTSNLVAERRGG